MKTLPLQIPDSLALEPKEVAMLLATLLYERGDLSLGQAGLQQVHVYGAASRLRRDGF